MRTTATICRFMYGWTYEYVESLSLDVYEELLTMIRELAEAREGAD